MKTEKRPLTNEEMRILGMLDKEFPADKDPLPPVIWHPQVPAVKKHRKRVFGALSKLANHYNWEPWTLSLVRIMTVAFTIAGYGALIPIYIVASIFLPDENDGRW